MKRLFLFLVLAPVVLSSPAATTNITPWAALFQGVDYSSARVLATAGGEKNEAISCLRVDLMDPDVSFFTTPHCTNGCALDTLSENTSHFLETYGLQVAVNCNFYGGSPGGNDSLLGTPDDVEGLAVSQGNLVSPAADDTRPVAMLFSTNNLPSFVPHNWPPTNLDGVFTAIGGNILLVTNGLNAGTNVFDNDPRTAYGLSQDNRYLYIMTVDGRQINWSDGMNFYELADWLIRFGAYTGMNVDGGGSTTMCMADCQGKSIRLNKSSFVAGNGRERNIGHNFGVYARPLPSEIKDVVVTPGTTTALVTWNTDFESNSRVEYGLTTNYGSATPLDTRLVKAHVATLAGLLAGTNYFFRVLSSDGVTPRSLACSLNTTSAVRRTLVFDVNKSWKYTTNNLDGINWKAPGYDDSGWQEPGAGLLYLGSFPSGTGAPRVTLLPGTPTGQAMRTYYFRTHFNFSGTTNGLSLTFSNYIDDGAVFYLNGAEIIRLRMQGLPAVITATTFATGRPCGTQGDPTCPDVFTMNNAFLSNLVQGDNVLSVEVHNYSSGSSDIAFGSALFRNELGVVMPQIFVSMNGEMATLFWNGAGFTLQQSADVSSSTNWVNVPGPITTSPITVTNNGTLFYRLRQ